MIKFPDEIKAWVESAAPGSVLEYRQGEFMPRARGCDRESKAMCAAWDAFACGLVELVQRRIDENFCSYLMIKRKQVRKPVFWGCYGEAMESTGKRKKVAA